jgi:PhoPQ-activated pathogenicity-related protein
MRVVDSPGGAVFYRDDGKACKQDSKQSIAAKYILMMHCETWN